MDQPPPLPSEPVNIPAAPVMSLPARLLNIFAVPSEVFLEIKDAQCRISNWLVPMILLALVGAVSVMLVMRQPAILQKIRDQQTKAIDDRVKAGKMTQEQADKALEITEKYMTPQIMTIAGMAGAILGSGLKILWWGFVLWLMAVWGLKTTLPFGKTLELAGLVMMIAVLGGIVSLLLTINLSRLGATPSLALMIQDMDLTRRGHVALGAINIFNFWQIILLALGLAKLTGATFARAAVIVLGFWFIQESLLILIGLGQMAL